MRKTKKKFIAMLAVFTSIVSFLPVGFSGQAANAADTATTDATTVHIYNGSGNSPVEIQSTNNQYYSSEITDNPSAKFDIAVKNVTVDTNVLHNQATSNSTSGSGQVSGITHQEVTITAINGIPYPSSNPNEFSDLGITVGNSTDPNIIGQRITGMPLGVNKITYKVKAVKSTYNYTAATYNTDGTVKTAAQVDTTSTDNTTEYTDQNVTIYYGAQYVSSAISAMTFKSYTGDPNAFDSNDNIKSTDPYAVDLKNNQVPFLYTTPQARPDSAMPLKYNFDVPFSLKKLTYIMNFANSQFSSAIIYKNGAVATGITISTDGTNTKLSGDLENMGSSDLILIRTNEGIKRSFCIEIDYNYQNKDKDYTMVDSGITKSNYQNDDTIDAYIGKKFTVSRDNTDSYNIYTGDLYLDKKAGKISIDPTLSVDKDARTPDQRTLAYTITNTTNNGTINSSPKDGKQWIDFDYNGSNTIIVNVYKGNNGNADISSGLLARYVLRVNINDSGQDFRLDLAFDHNTISSTYLTQPGVNSNKINFNINRLTYDLYYTNTTPASVKVTFTGTKSQHNEYLKFWTSNGIDSNALNDATVARSGDDYVVDLTGAKKIVVQPYYDSTTGAAASYPVGTQQYVFYLPQNFSTSDTTPDSGNTPASNNASLTNLTVKDATLIQGSGATGFSSNVDTYTVTVDKETTTALITATADKVKSITATVEGSNGSYQLASGLENEFSLNSSGNTVIDIVVTAMDGITTKKYTVTIKNNTKSSLSALKDLILNTGDYTFDPNQSTTKVRVDQNVSTIKLTPVPKDSKATVTVNGQTYSGSPISINLKGAQKTEVQIVVKSEDGTQSTTYTVDIYRVDPADWNNNNNNNNGDQYDDDQFYDDYNDCWVDLTKYEEWGTINGKPAYFDNKNRQVKNAWITTGGKLYYLNNLGFRASGWKVDTDGKTYYLDPTTGELKTGWINLNNTWYYLGKNGIMEKGWKNINGKWYYFTPNGQMIVNQSMYIDDNTYTFAQDGTLVS